MKTQQNRPYALTEEDYSAMLNVIKTMRLFEYLADEHNPTVNTIECDLVASTLHLLSGQLEQVMTSIDHHVVAGIDEVLATRQ